MHGLLPASMGWFEWVHVGQMHAWAGRCLRVWGGGVGIRGTENVRAWHTVCSAYCMHSFHTSAHPLLCSQLNTYAMRVREWYGWHYPEMGKIVPDNLEYARIVKALGDRSKAQEADLAGICANEDTAQEVKDAAMVSMGTEVRVVC